MRGPVQASLLLDFDNFSLAPFLVHVMGVLLSNPGSEGAPFFWEKSYLVLLMGFSLLKIRPANLILMKYETKFLLTEWSQLLSQKELVCGPEACM